jgi:hypothetical protein
VGDAAELPLAKLAKEYAVADRFFQAAFGGSFLSHSWLVASAPPPWNSSKPVPPDMISVINDTAVPPVFHDNPLDVGGRFAVNTVYSENTPVRSGYSPVQQQLQRQQQQSRQQQWY